MKNTNVDTLRKDLKDLNHAEFEKKYPNIQRDSIQGLSDAELEKVAGGARDPVTGKAIFPRGYK